VSARTIHEAVLTVLMNGPNVLSRLTRALLGCSDSPRALPCASSSEPSMTCPWHSLSRSLVNDPGYRRSRAALVGDISAPNTSPRLDT